MNMSTANDLYAAAITQWDAASSIVCQSDDDREAYNKARARLIAAIAEKDRAGDAINDLMNRLIEKYRRGEK